MTLSALQRLEEDHSMSISSPYVLMKCLGKICENVSLSLQTASSSNPARSDSMSNSKLSQMMIHVEIGMAHPLSPGHLSEHRMGGELAL
jgi:hypothetical protein